MSIWKKSEDPWDRKPDKRRPKSWEPQESKEPQDLLKAPVDALKKWNEDRKAADAANAAPDLPPEKCPWCGKDMEQGYMVGGRGTVWYPGRLTTKAAWIGRRDVKGLNVLDEGNLFAYKTTWLCRDCKKMVFTMPEPLEVYDPFAGEATDEQKEGEN